MRRLAVVACAFGLLFALPVSAATAKVVAVPLSLEVRSGNSSNNNCAAVAYLHGRRKKTRRHGESNISGAANSKKRT